MRHLTTDECVNALEGHATVDVRAHLNDCVTCRETVERLRRTCEAVEAIDVPEPSPLFWDHLSARISRAIDAEPAPRLTRWPQLAGVLGRRGWLPAAGAVAIALLAIVVLPRAGRVVPAPNEPAASVVIGAPEIEPELTANGSADDQWDLMVHMAAEVELDQADLGLGMGTADRALEGLSDEERRELVQWLRQELAASGGGTL